MNDKKDNEKLKKAEHDGEMAFKAGLLVTDAIKDYRGNLMHFVIGYMDAQEEEKKRSKRNANRSN